MRAIIHAQPGNMAQGPVEAMATQVTVTTGEGPSTVVVEVAESEGALYVTVLRGDPIWGMAVDPRTGGKPAGRLLVVDP